MCGMAAKRSFDEKVLMPYFRTQTRYYLEANWDKPEVMEDIERLRSMPPIGDEDTASLKIPAKESSKEDVILAVNNYVKYCVDKKVENKGIVMLR